jgi:hypothetical protein
MKEFMTHYKLRKSTFLLKVRKIIPLYQIYKNSSLLIDESLEEKINKNI